MQNRNVIASLLGSVVALAAGGINAWQQLFDKTQNPTARELATQLISHSNYWVVLSAVLAGAAGFMWARDIFSEPGATRSDIEELQKNFDAKFEELLARSDVQAPHEIEAFKSTTRSLVTSPSLSDNTFAIQIFEDGPVAAAEKTLGDLSFENHENSKKAVAAAKILAPFDPQRAINAYSLALDLDQNSFDALSSMLQLQAIFGLKSDIDGKLSERIREVSDPVGRAECLRSLALIHANSGNFHSAIEVSHEALEVWLDPDTKPLSLCSIHLGVPDLYQDIGNAYISLNKMRDARSAFEESRQYLGSLPRPRCNDQQERFGAALSGAAQAEFYLGEHESAYRLARAALCIQKRLVSKGKSSVVLSRNIAISYQTIGSLRSMKESFSSALQNYQESQNIFLELHEKHPENLRIKYDLALSYQYTGIARYNLDEVNRAISDFQNAQRLTNEVIVHEPENFSLLRLLALLNEQLCTSHRKLGKPDIARSFGTKALEGYKDLFNDEEPNVQLVEDQARTVNSIGCCEMDAGNYSVASGHFLTAADLWRVAAKRNVGSTLHLNSLRESITNLVSSLYESGQSHRIEPFAQEIESIDKEINDLKSKS